MFLHGQCQQTKDPKVKTYIKETGDFHMLTMFYSTGVQWGYVMYHIHSLIRFVTNPSSAKVDFAKPKTFEQVENPQNNHSFACLGRVKLFV